MSGIKIKGRLSFKPDGSEESVDCGEAEFTLDTGKGSLLGNGIYVEPGVRGVTHKVAGRISPNVVVS